MNRSAEETAEMVEKLKGNGRASKYANPITCLDENRSEHNPQRSGSNNRSLLQDMNAGLKQNGELLKGLQQPDEGKYLPNNNGGYTGGGIVNDPPIQGGDDENTGDKMWYCESMATMITSVVLVMIYCGSSVAVLFTDKPTDEPTEEPGESRQSNDCLTLGIILGLLVISVVALSLSAVVFGYANAHKGMPLTPDKELMMEIGWGFFALACILPAIYVMVSCFCANALA